MQDYQERVHVEAAQLNEKAKKLAEFMRGEVFKKLAVEDQELLMEQGNHMAAYLEVLTKRIGRFV